MGSSHYVDAPAHATPALSPPNLKTKNTRAYPFFFILLIIILFATLFIVIFLARNGNSFTHI